VAQFAFGLSTGDFTMAESFAQVARFLPGPDAGEQMQPRWGCDLFIRPPRVARSSQPWAEGCNPVGVVVCSFADFRVHFGLGELELFGLVVTFGVRFWTLGRRGWEPVKVREVNAVPVSTGESPSGLAYL
jgi:hypothetical protein